MKKRAAILLIAILFGLTLGARAQEGPTKAEENGCTMLIGLANHGYIKYYPGDGEGFLVRIEPLFWKKALHRDKVDLMQAAMNTARFLNRKAQKHYTTIMFIDMTTEADLAVAWIEGGISPGKIKIIR